MQSYKIVKFGVARAPCREEPTVTTWRHSFPPDTLQRSLLVEPSQPHVWEFLPLSQPLQSFNTYVSGSDLYITGFSVQTLCGDYCSVGVTDATVIMLAFCSSKNDSDGLDSRTTLQVSKSSETGLCSLKVYVDLVWCYVP